MERPKWQGSRPATPTSVIWSGFTKRKGRWVGRQVGLLGRWQWQSSGISRRRRCRAETLRLYHTTYSRGWQCTGTFGSVLLFWELTAVGCIILLTSLYRTHGREGCASLLPLHIRVKWLLHPCTSATRKFKVNLREQPPNGTTEAGTERRYKGAVGAEDGATGARSGRPSIRPDHFRLRGILRHSSGRRGHHLWDGDKQL